MNRTLATALVLVNWRGVFYERYLLDRHVTALEGANGAGKTTVMIAAYVALLPDLTRLRFTNLGETGATGGDRGIWGRLGEAGRPSYTVLQLRLPDGSSMLAGVHLEKKAEPSLEVTPFIVDPWDASTRMQELLLQSDGEHDEIPTLPELRNHAKRLGARLTVFPSAKEYFSVLFERGVTPMRMALDEARNKYNEMLRTSMTGGISRALTSQLRTFVLKEESALSDTLARMRGNLGACRKTRTEVQEARILEHEICGIFDAGQAMFAAAWCALRAAAREHNLRIAGHRRRAEELGMQLAKLERDLAAAEGHKSTIAAEIQSLREALEATRARRERLVRAMTLRERCEALAEEVARHRTMAESSEREHQEITERRARARQILLQCQDNFVRTAQSLADLQAGLDELHRKAHAHRIAHEKLQALRVELGRPELDLADLPEVRRALVAERHEVDRALALRDRERSSAVHRRAEYDAARAALRTVAGELAADEDLHERARHELRRLRQLETVALRLPELRRRGERLSERLERREAFEGRLRAVELDEVPEDAPALLRLLGKLDAEVADREEEQRQHTWRARESAQRAEHLRRHIGDLEAREHQWSRIQRALDLVEAGGEPLEPTREALQQRRSELVARQSRLQVRLEACESERQAAQASAHALESSEAGGPSAGLLELREQLDAEFLAQRYEDLDPDEARRVQALLGPLIDALVVEDLAAAATAIQKQGTAVDEAWIVAADVDPCRALGTSQVSSASEIVVVESSLGLRVTRVPEQARLGRQARQRRVGELRKQAEQLATVMESIHAELHRVGEVLPALETLDAGLSTWLAGPPGEALKEARTQLEALLEEEQEARRCAAEARARIPTARARAQHLRALLPEAGALEGGLQREALAEFEAELREAERAQEELERVAAAREALAEGLEALRRAPPSDAELATWAEQHADLEARRDRSFALLETSTALELHGSALAWDDAQHVLADRRELVPELREQHARAEQSLHEAKAELERREAEWEVASEAHRGILAAYEAARAHHLRATHELEAEGFVEPGQEELEAIDAQLETSARKLLAVETEERSRETQLALDRDRCTRLAEAVRVEEQELEIAEDAAKPAALAWSQMQRRMEETGVLAASVHDGSLDTMDSASLWPEARSKSALLLDRLEAARGGQELAKALRQRLDGDGELGEIYLRVWLDTQEWLRKRLPSHIAEGRDPLAGLQRLREDLSRLEVRLARQEEDLRGTSEDVAHSIDVQIRRAANQVERLNRHLAGVTFGSIDGIRIQMHRVENMETVLSALRDGSAQQLLFHSAMSIEDAMEEIFRRYGGGGRAGAQRILDYREYIELRVEVLRRSGTDWELANPTRVSTGEAIGVGAALMMVILAEWERDANLLRAQKGGGCLRFLFLDEANRLSQDNLAVLFDLCEKLDLQLLIAAPEVAHAEGNTTYRLVRRQLEDGREEVLVSGRRGSLPPTMHPAIAAAPNEATAD